MGLTPAGGQKTSGMEAPKIEHPNISPRLLRHIPKVARSEPGRLLTNINNALLDQEKVDSWRNIPAFAATIFELPTRGDKRHNLTSSIRRRKTDFNQLLNIKSRELFEQDKSHINHTNRRLTNNETPWHLRWRPK